MNLDDFSYQEEDRRYIDPNVSLNEQNAFIQNLRDTQVQRNAQIAQQTHNLGTDVPSNLGGLTGSEAYFNARYQTPQTNSMIADLKTTAQAQALSEALNNELAKAKQRYTNAYRAAQKRSGNNTTTPTDTTGDADIEYIANDPVGTQYRLEKAGTEGVLPEAGATSLNTREYYILDKNGGRTPIRVYGSGSSIGLQTPTIEMDDKDAINNYIQEKIKEGGKVMARDNNGKVTDISSGYRIQWGI